MFKYAYIYMYICIERERERGGEREREIWAGKIDQVRQLRDAICASLPPAERAAADARFPHICITLSVSI